MIFRKKNLEKIIKEVLQTLDINEPISFSVEQTEDLVHGDYASNVALVASKKLKISPKETAEKIKEVIEKKLPKEISHIEIAGVGFINFFLTDNAKAENLKLFLNDNFKKECVIEKGNVLFEYTDPNCFKSFHLGHLMANTIGESLSRIYEAVGFNVTRICYPSDIGRNVAMGVWGVMKNKDKMPSDNSSLEKKVAFLGECYAYANEQFESNEKSKEEIIKINQEIYSGEKGEVMDIYNLGKEWSLDYFEIMYKKLGTYFDGYIYESEVSEKGLAIVKEFLNKVFEESEGAIVYKGEQDGLHTRVFVNQKGLPTYEAKDLGNYARKVEMMPDAKFYAVVTANEQNEYFKVVNKVTEKIYPKLTGKLLHFGHGMLRLPSGKMSSRTGNVISAEEILNIISARIEEKFTELEVKEKIDDLINDVAVGAVKFSILKQGIGRDIIFDIEKSISFEGDSGPYLQYTHARIKQLIAKAYAKNIGVEINENHPQEKQLETFIYQFPEIILSAYEEKAPQHIVNYLIKLTREFNSFYARQIIVDEKNKDSVYYVALAQATGNAIAYGLHILGITAPEKM